MARHGSDYRRSNAHVAARAPTKATRRQGFAVTGAALVLAASLVALVPAGEASNSGGLACWEHVWTDGRHGPIQSWSNHVHPFIAWDCSAATKPYEVWIWGGGLAPKSLAVTAEPSLHFPSLPEGEWMVGLSGRGPGEPSGRLMLTYAQIDTTPPVAWFGTPHGPAVTRDGTVYATPATSFSFFARDPEPGQRHGSSGVARVESRVDAGVWSSGETRRIAAAEGPHRLEVRAFDRLAHESPVQAMDVVLDFTGPIIRFLEPEPVAMERDEAALRACRGTVRAGETTAELPPPPSFTPTCVWWQLPGAQVPQASLPCVVIPSGYVLSPVCSAARGPHLGNRLEKVVVVDGEERFVADVADASVGLAGVEWLLDGEIVKAETGERVVTEVTLSDTTVTAGEHSLVLRAWDRLGNVRELGFHVLMLPDDEEGARFTVDESTRGVVSRLREDAEEEAVAVSVLGNATTREACVHVCVGGGVSVSGTGESRSELIAVSGTGPARCRYDGDGYCTTVSGTGPSRGGQEAVSVTGDAECTNRYGCVAFGVTGRCNGDACQSVEPDGNARAHWLAASATGDASGAGAASGTGDADAHRTECARQWGAAACASAPAVSALGNASCAGFCVAASGTGESSGWIALSGTGETSARETCTTPGYGIAGPVPNVCVWGAAVSLAVARDAACAWAHLLGDYVPFARWPCLFLPD